MWHTKRINLYRARLVLVLAMIATIWFVWIGASVIDTNVHNLNDPQHISNWNIFKISQSV